jgi:transposase
MDYRTGRVHYMAHPKKNAQQFHEFLRQLLEVNSERRLVLVLNNASYHRTKKVLALLEDHADHAFVVRLPRYSPELNLIEGLWGYLKGSALNNYFFGDIDTLEAAIHDAFANLQQHPETALSLAYKIDTKLRKTA